MISEWLRRTVFAEKLVDLPTVGDESMLFAFDLPWTRGDDGRTGTTSCGLFPPRFEFYGQLAVILLIQSAFSAILGAFVYKILVEPPRRRRRREHGEVVVVVDDDDDEKSADSSSSDSSNTNAVDISSWLFAFGVAVPCVFVEPILLARALDVRNVGLIMGMLGTPIVNSLRIAEAFFGFAPFPVGVNMRNYLVYFSCAFGVEFDAATGRPKPVTLTFLRKRTTTLLRDYVVVFALISFLNHHGYEVFGTNHRAPVNSTDHDLADLLSWRHLANNFLVALLISTSLSQSTLGVSLLYNVAYGVQTYELVRSPMWRSKSPSDFWGRRWNLLVHKGLKNGVYKPTREHTSSKVAAVAATFVVSGIIHEYVNWAMYNHLGYEFEWKQMLFFGWNGFLVATEYYVGHWYVFQWASETLPPILVTALVICSALPLAHLFTGDWIKNGYFDAVFIAQPVVVCERLSMI